MTDSSPYTSPQGAPAPGPPPRRIGVRAILGGLGPLGFVLVVAAFLMQHWAMNHGVHCPECDQPTDIGWWRAYFSVRDDLFLGAFGGGLVALLAGLGLRWRLLGLGAMAVAFFGFGMMPM